MFLFNSAPLSAGPHPVSSSKSGFSVTLSLKLQLADFSTVTAAFFATSRWRPLCHYALQRRRTTQTLPSTLTLTIDPLGPILKASPFFPHDCQEHLGCIFSLLSMFSHLSFLSFTFLFLCPMCPIFCCAFQSINLGANSMMASILKNIVLKKSVEFSHQ